MLVLGLGPFLVNLDITAVVVALPAMGRELGFGPEGHARVMDAYSLAFTAALLAAGALADRHGRRRALLGGNLLFLLASAACGLAPDGGILVAARVLQGLAAAFVITGALALIPTAYPEPAHRARAFAILGVGTGAAMALGPTLGGLVAEAVGWRLIFLVNLPLCAVIGAALPRIVPEARDEARPPADWPGITLLTLALALSVEALLQARENLALAALGLPLAGVLLAAFAARERRRLQPTLDPRLFRHPAVLGVSLVILAVSLSYWSALVYLPPFLADAFAMGGGQIGVAMLAATLPMLVLPPFGASLLPRVGWRRLFAVSLILISCGTAVLAGAALFVGPSGLALAYLGMALAGIGAALAHPQLSGALLALAPPEAAGMASALTIVMRQGGFAIGIAVLGAAVGAGTSMDRFAAAFALASAAALLGAAAASRLLPAAERDG